MFDYNFLFSDMMYVLYWFPVVICVLYTMSSVTKDIAEDIRLRKTYEFYYPKTTFGEIFVLLLMSVCPVLNVLFVFLHIIPDVFSGLIQKITNFMNMPVIPRRK